MVYRRATARKAKKPTVTTAKTEYQKKKTAKAFEYLRQDEVYLEDLEWWSGNIDEFDGPDRTGHPPIPPTPELPRGVPLNAVEMHALIDRLTLFFAEGGYTEVFYKWEGLGVEMFLPLLPEEVARLKARRKTQAAARAKRVETAKRNALKRKERTQREEKEKLRKLAEKYPEEIRTLNNNFED